MEVFIQKTKKGKKKKEMASDNEKGNVNVCSTEDQWSREGSDSIVQL